MGFLYHVARSIKCLTYDIVILYLIIPCVSIVLYISPDTILPDRSDSCIID